MNKELEAKNLIQFRLTGTPDGNLLVSFYHLDVFNQQAVNWHIAGLLVENKLSARVLYEGNLSNNTAYQTAISNLLERPGRRCGQRVCQLRADRDSKIVAIPYLVSIMLTIQQNSSR